MKKAIKITFRVILIIICLMILFLLGVFIYHRVMLSKEKSLISQPLGDMIEVDNGKMCVYTEGTGEHTIVFMSGYGTPSPILDFKPLYDKLSNDYRIVVVEKFGYGFSDETDMSRDVDTMLKQTREALQGAGIEAPYILCPHSASGIEAMYWAQTYPEEIEGITALDIAIPGYHEESGDSIFADKAMRYIVNSGIIRLANVEDFGWCVGTPYLTEEENKIYKALIYSRRGSKTMVHEAECCKKNMQIISDNGAPDVPMLFFISKQQAKIQFPNDPDKYLQLYRNYTNNKQEYIDMDCGHYVHLYEPDFIADEIKKFIGELDNE
jgi:pimeloyl-ACP methyl ester carboxylesterase